LLGKRGLWDKTHPRKRRRSRKRRPRDFIGVYLLLLLNDEIVYIGTSLDMPERVATHRQHGRPFDRVVYIPTLESEREALERILIRAINPRQNRNGKSAVQIQPNVDGGLALP
jgi:hypothetical protein